MSKTLHNLHDLILGKKELVYELTFFQGIINLIIGGAVALTVLNYWHLIMGIIIILAGISGIIVVIIPLAKIKTMIDVLCTTTILYGGVELINNGGFKQMSIALLIIYVLLCVWRWYLEGVERGYINKASH